MKRSPILLAAKPEGAFSTILPVMPEQLLDDCRGAAGHHAGPAPGAWRENLIGAYCGKDLGVLNGDIEIIAGVENETIWIWSRRCSDSASAGNRCESAAASGFIGEHADAVVFTVSDVEVVELSTMRPVG
jgi:hypothetical protein